MSAVLEAKVEKAGKAIARAARKNHHLTVTALQRELEDGLIVAWENLCARRHLNFSEWSAAMSLAIAELSK